MIDPVPLPSPLGKIETPNAKKRHRRLPHGNASNSTNSNGAGGEDDGDENIFIIVSLDKQWYFEAQTNEERDEWVQAIEQQILCSLQNIESSKAARAAKIGGPSMADFNSIQTIKQISGNGFCADCEQISEEKHFHMIEAKGTYCFNRFRSNLGFIEFGSSDLYGLCILASESWYTSVSCSLIGIG